MVLEINHLQKNYGQFHLSCTLGVKRGRITGLVGPNGAGKSTVFKAVLGLIKPEGGEIRLFDRDVCDFSAVDKRLYGAALSDSGFSGWLSVRDVIPMLEKLYPGFDRREFAGKCRHFGLPLNKKIKEFSTGMKAKLKVITALSHGARLLLLDEPTAGLDVVARDEILGLLREFMEEDEERAILISSHISSDLENFCDDIYMISDGEIVFHEDTDVLLGEYALLKVSEEQYGTLDKQYLLRVRKESYGYQCLTGKRQFYLENYPETVVERSSIDELIYMMMKGETVC